MELNNKLKSTKLTIDKSLDKLDGKILFPKKLEKFKEALRISGIPKQLFTSI
jgi:hypothetical protein